MAQPIALSLTRMNVFRHCAFRYKLKYIDWVPGRREIANKHLAFGASMHAAMAEYHRSPAEQRTLRGLLGMLEAKWDGRGYASDEEQAEWNEKGRRMLQSYHFDPQDRGDTLMVEELLRVVSASGKGEFIGRIDRVVRRPDGLVELVDYKTGRAPEGTLASAEGGASGGMPADERESQRLLTDRQQLMTYALLFRRRNGGKPPDFVSAYYLETGKKHSYRVAEADLKEAGQHVAGLFKTIAAETEFKPQPSIRCRTDCEYFGEACTPDLDAVPEFENLIDF